LAPVAATKVPAVLARGSPMVRTGGRDGFAFESAVGLAATGHSTGGAVGISLLGVLAVALFGTVL